MWLRLTKASSMTFGVDFDEAEAAKIPFDGSRMQPRLKAKDGSVRDF